MEIETDAAVEVCIFYEIIEKANSWIFHIFLGRLDSKMSGKNHEQLHKRDNSKKSKIELLRDGFVTTEIGLFIENILCITMGGRNELELKPRSIYICQSITNSSNRNLPTHVKHIPKTVLTLSKWKCHFAAHTHTYTQTHLLTLNSV